MCSSCTLSSNTARKVARRLCIVMCWNMFFQLPRLPMGCTDEAGERDLRLGKQFAGLMSTVADKSIAETLGHGMYVKFLGCRAWRSQVHLWHPERREVVKEQCVVSASPMWRAEFEWLLGKVLQEDTVKCYMHVATQLLYITTNACQPQMDMWLLRH